MVENKDIIIQEGDEGFGYGRLSEKEKNLPKEEQSKSITNQVSLIEKYFKEHKLILLKPIYKEDDTSGSKDKATKTGFKWHRKVMKQVLDDATEFKKTHPRLKCLVVKNLDRFARKSSFQDDLIDEFNNIGIKLISIMDDVDNVLARQMAGISNEYLSAVLKRKTEMTHKDKLEIGQPFGRTPIGYKYEIKNERRTGKWIIDKSNSKDVLDIFTDFVNGMPVKELEDKYAITKIKRVLSNKIYIGTITCNGQEITADIPLFLSRDLFDKAQEKLKSMQSITIHQRIKSQSF